jgi:hypothetical protein
MGKEMGTKYSPNTWSPNGKRALFLIGDMLRINRFPVLYEFYRNSDLHKLEYSLDYNYIGRFSNINQFYNTDTFKKFLSFMKEAYNLNYNEFKKKYTLLERKLVEDSFDAKVKSALFSHFDISAYHYPKQWANSSLIITMETQFFNIISEQPNSKETNTFTEKIWKPISTRKPFILCSDKDYQYSILESMGFKTFLEYTSHPNKISHSYKDMTDKSYYPKLAYQRTCSFLNNMSKHERQIKNDTEHNYSLWLKLGKELWEKLYIECPVIQEIPKHNIINLCLLAGENNYITDQNMLTKIFS